MPAHDGYISFCPETKTKKCTRSYKISNMLMCKQMAIHHRMHLCTTMDNFTSQLTALSLNSLMLAAGCMTFLRFRKWGQMNALSPIQISVKCFVHNYYWSEWCAMHILES